MTNAVAGDDERHRLTAVQGLAALSLDALSSVAYGPEAILVVLVAAGAAGLRYSLPVTGASRRAAGPSSRLRHRDGRRPAGAEGLRLRVLGADRGRGDRERRAGVPHAPGPPGAANRGL